MNEEQSPPPLGRAVVADDDPRNAETMATVCKGLGIETTTVYDGEEAFDEISRGGVDLVLLDLNMPRLDGFGVLEKLREHMTELRPAVIIVTAAADVSGRIRGTDLGALDFMQKPFRLDDLKRRVQRALSVVDMERRLKEAENHLRSIKGTDPITGVGTFGRLHAVLEAEFNCARVGLRALSCVIISDESYGCTLDTGGRVAGEERLQILSRLIEERLRSADYLFRVDAAEFVLLLPATEGTGAHIVVRKISDTIASFEELSVNDFAIAVASYPHPQLDQAATLFRAANVALAQARSRPAERVAFFERF